MPLNRTENMPEALRRQSDVFSKFCNGFTEPKVDDQAKEWKVGSSVKFAPSESMDIVDGTFHIACNYPMDTLMKQAKV